jgi:hypothetical protein
MERTFTRRDGTVGEVRRLDGVAMGVGPEPRRKAKFAVVERKPYRTCNSVETDAMNAARHRRAKAMAPRCRKVRPASERLKYGEAF